VAPPVKITTTLVWTDGMITPGPNGENYYVITVSEQLSGSRAKRARHGKPEDCRNGGGNTQSLKVTTLRVATSHE
jgi:hypothetical protein